jgi:hypothetical protein
MRKPCLLPMFLFLAIVHILMTIPAHGHHPGTVLTSFGTATVDGVMMPGEWDGAAKVEFLANVPANDGGGTTPAILFVMNDEINLYLALVVQRSSFGGATNPVFEIDVDHNGVIEEGDEGFGMSVGIFSPANFRDSFRTTQPPCPENALCGFADTDFGGTSDGITAASNDGQFTVIEIARPLDSGDIHDFSLQPGDRIGFQLTLRLFALDPQCNTCLADTHFPRRRPRSLATS